MNIRPKLTLILLAVALIPLTLVGGVLLLSFFRFGDHLADHERKILARKAHEQLTVVRNSYSAELTLKQDILRSLLNRERDLLKQSFLSGQHVADLAGRVDRDIKDLLRTTPRGPSLGPIRSELHISSGEDKREEGSLPDSIWQMVLKEESWHVGENINGSPSQLSISGSFGNAGGQAVGSLRLSVHMDHWFPPVHYPASWSGEVRQLLMRSVVNQKNRQFKVLAERFSSTQGWVWNEADSVLELEDIHGGAAADVTMVGNDMVWVEGVSSHWLELASGPDGLVVGLLVPHHVVIADAENASRHARSELSRGLLRLGGSILLVALVVLVLAFRLSRKYSGPVLELSKVAKHISDGDYMAEAKVCSKDEIGGLADILNSLGPRLADRERLINDVGAAKKIQEHLWPDYIPVLSGGGSLAGRSRPCEETGGDYFDLFEMTHNRVALVLGDVTGHGLAAALLMASARASLRALVETGEDGLEKLFRHLNQILCRDAGDDRFMSLFFAIYHPANNLLCWNSAGQAPVYLCRSDGTGLIELQASGPPLGISDSVDYQELTSLQLQEGDLLVAATDGFWENRNVTGNPFGLERLESLILNNRHLSADVLQEKLFTEAASFSEGVAAEDDLTVVVLKAGIPLGE